MAGIFIAIFKGQPILTGVLSRNVTIFELMAISSVSSRKLWPEAFSPWTKAGRESGSKRSPRQSPVASWMEDLFSVRLNCSFMTWPLCPQPVRVAIAHRDEKKGDFLGSFLTCSYFSCHRWVSSCLLRRSKYQIFSSVSLNV